jgi:hypothetical protein
MKGRRRADGPPPPARSVLRARRFQGADTAPSQSPRATGARRAATCPPQELASMGPPQRQRRRRERGLLLSGSRPCQRREGGAAARVVVGATALRLLLRE